MVREGRPYPDKLGRFPSRGISSTCPQASQELWPSSLCLLDIHSCSANEREQLNIPSKPFGHTTSSTFHISLGSTWRAVPKAARGRVALLQGQGRWRQRWARSAPSAWVPWGSRPLWPIACTSSALGASGSGPRPGRIAPCAGSPWSRCFTPCEATTTTSSLWWACPPACAGGWPWTGPAGAARSAATTCAGGWAPTRPRPDGVTPWMARASTWAPRAPRDRGQLQGPPTSQPKQLLQPSLLRSHPTGPALVLLQTHTMAQSSCRASTIFNEKFGEWKEMGNYGLSLSPPVPKSGRLDLLSKAVCINLHKFRHCRERLSNIPLNKLLNKL